MKHRNKPKFNRGHFPKGTICTIEIPPDGPKNVEVWDISVGGANNFLIDTRTVSTTSVLANNLEKIPSLGKFYDKIRKKEKEPETDILEFSPLKPEYDTYSIVWVTNIIKRGTGSTEVNKDHRNQFLKRYAENQMKEYGECGIYKHPSQYMSLSTRELIYTVAQDYLTDDMLLNMEKLSETLYNRNIFKLVPVGDNQDFTFGYFVVNKKKLRRTIKQVINRCLSKREKTQRLDDEEFEKMAEADFLSDLDFGYSPPSRLTDDNRPRCSGCHEVIMDHLPHGTLCEDCDDEMALQSSYYDIDEGEKFF